MIETTFNFYCFQVNVSSPEEKIHELLKIDFRYFLKSNTIKKTLKLELYLVEDLSGLVPKGLIANKQSINSMTYDLGKVRYNDYYGEVVSVFDYKNESCKIYAKNLNRLHEVSYLVILSRQGKWCDRNGLHKIHAMSITKNDKTMVLMLPMKGGKSTLFTQFLEKKEVGLVSDDSPVVNFSGDILPFPIRFGLEQREVYKDLIDSIPAEYKSILERKQYGSKVLVDLTYYKERIGKVGSKIILIQGVRHNSTKTIIKKINFFKMYKYLITNLVVGIGLPMIIEYFLESSLKDKITNTQILFSRSWSAFRLTLKSENYLVYMGTDIVGNAENIDKLFE